MNRRLYAYAWMQVWFILALALSGCNPSITPMADSAPQPEGVRELKLMVNQAGLYQVTAEALRRAGMLVEDPSQLSLSLRTQPVPLWLEESIGDFSLYFYGVPPDSPYTRENVYWLSKLETAQITTRSMEILKIDPMPAEFSEHYQVSRLFSEKKVFSPLIGKDPWYWFSIFAPGTQTLDLNLGDPASGEATLRLQVWGATQAPTDFDHHLRVFVNERMVLDEWWDGSGARELEAALPTGVLQTGSNHVIFDSPGDTGALADSLFIQAIDFTYPQASNAEDQFILIGEGKALVLKKRFDYLDVLDVTQPQRPIRLDALQQSTGEFIFTAEMDHQYLVVHGRSALVPSISMPSEVPSAMLSDLGADYLVIGSPDLMEPLNPLMEYRQKQGLTSLMLPWEAVYDHFNAGFPEPEAINALLQVAFSHWKTKPRYLLLVGDASYDPKGYLGDPAGKMIPIYFVETMYGGLTGSDLPYADIDQDIKPDLAIGRVPANSPAEVRNWVQKTLAYEQTLAVTSPFNILAVADGQEASFSRDAQAFLDFFDESYPVKLFSPQPGSTDATSQVVEDFQTGYQLIAYFGHGSLDMWGKDKLLTVEDVAALNNSQLPVVFTMTCLNGFFFHPTNTSLAEALILAPDAGAAAVLAPTSLTLVWDQNFLGQVLYPALADPGAHRLGDVLLQAQRSMPLDTQGQRDVLLTFLLFGDPALRLRVQ
jgi:hypothetical protein